MAKIIKRKKLFEEDFGQAGQVAQPAAQPTQPQQAQPQQPQQAQPQQPAQPAAQLQQPQQQVQQPQPLQQQQPLQLQQQTTDIENKVKEVCTKLENAYWAIANNVPEEIQKAIPEFKAENPQAKPITDLWDKFKKEPNQDTYNEFINAFKGFGAPALTDQLQQQQQQQAVNAGYIADFDFKQALRESLQQNSRKQAIIESLNYYYDPE